MFVPRAQNPGLAVAFMLAASGFIAGSTLFAKAVGAGHLGEGLHPLQVSHGRFVFAFMALSAVMAVVRPRLTRVHWRLHLGRTGLGWAGVSLMFAAVAFIPLGDATAISFLNPVFAMVLAIPLLGETVGRIRWAAAAIAMAGALILLRPGSEAFQPAALLALAAALMMGFELIFIKRLSGREAPLQILFVNNGIGLCIASLAVWPVWAQPTGAEWLGLAGVGLCMACAQACFVNAMARADASFVTPFSYVTLVFAGLYDFAVFAVVPDAVSLLGALVIVAGAAMLAWRQARAGRARPAVPPTGGGVG